MSLGSVLRDHRKAHGLTLRDVSAATGRHFTYLSHIEHDRYRPGRELLSLLVSLYGLTADEVVELNEIAGICPTCGNVRMSPTALTTSEAS